MSDYSRARERMVSVQIAGRGIRDRRVLDAMSRVPRESFVDPGYEEFAYEDSPLPTGEGQTISQPYIVALMIEAAERQSGSGVDMDMKEVTRHVVSGLADHRDDREVTAGKAQVRSRETRDDRQ